MRLNPHIRHFLTENQMLVVVLAIIAGLTFPALFKPIAGYGRLLLILIFFTSSLRLAFHELIVYAKDWKMLALSSLFMLLFLPVAMWLPVRYFAPEWALPFLIIGAMPTGMTIALIAEYFGGKTSLALLITTVTSLLAPFTIPLVFQLLLGQSIPIPTEQLFTDLILTIVVPFFLAAAVRRKAHAFIARHDGVWRTLSILLFGILISGIVADAANGATFHLGWEETATLFLMLIYAGVLTLLAYRMAWWRTPAERATIALCMVYMNNTLGFFIANRYFHEAHLIPQLVLIVLTVNALLPFLRWVASRATQSTLALASSNPFI